MNTSEQILTLLEGHEHDAVVNHLLKVIAAVAGGLEKVTGNCLGVTVTCYKVGEQIRIDLKGE